LSNLRRVLPVLRKGMPRHARSQGPFIAESLNPEAWKLTQIIQKMFHVKHFCPAGAENLTMPKTVGFARSGKIARLFGAITKLLSKRFLGSAHCQGIPNVGLMACGLR
jgi:hypothetical protein